MTFLWHDYETFGTHPALDRPAQFAAIRTDADLEPVGDPMCWYCKPADDALPHPMACLVTGITPQVADREGVVEAKFAQRIHAEMSEPGTCGVGYNSIRFDDEVSRHLFYRNFIDPYRREYANGNSRWDLIGLARMSYALRPGGVEWPEHEPGKPSFRLEDLTAANGIEHAGAHDALADVRATIELARLLKRHQPRLFDWTLDLRDKQAASALLNADPPVPLVHTAATIPAERGCTTLILPLAIQPDRPKSVIVFDLMDDPGPLLDLSAEQIAARLFTPAADLPADESRIALSTVATNRVPMLAPASVLQGVDLDRIGLDPDRCEAHARRIGTALPALRAKLREVYTPPPPAPGDDPDAMLYTGNFFSNADRAEMRRILTTPSGELGQHDWGFRDPRLPTMLFRYRARNYPETLSRDERDRWEADRLARLHFQGFRSELDIARRKFGDDPDKARLLEAVEAWVTALETPKVA